MTRSTLARAVYRRTSLPFRVGFRFVAWARSSRPEQVNGGGADEYVSTHAARFFVEQWTYGYHRVFELLSHFHPAADPASLRVLSLGPRTEIELYYLWCFFGFEWRNIEGLDLVSTSPKIRAGDMSRTLPFPDDSFDVIVASACLEKSRDPERTRDEIRRVARPDARVVVSGEYGDPNASDGSGRIPRRLFVNGVYGFIDVYGLQLGDIEYMDARAVNGYQIIFRVTK
jgi:hypothetical protein